jgi:NAD(P)-dependent dehydrogenase (short-subunit alcohol dehydrogenase family)
MSAAIHDVSGLVVLVMGGTTGLGWVVVERLVGQGAKVVVVGPDEIEMAAVLARLGPSAAGCVGDAREPDTAARAVQIAVDRFGRLDALYHVAGGSGRSRGDGPLHELTDEGWRYTSGLNLDSVFYSNRAAVRQFLAQGKGEGGAVVNLASVLAWSPSPRYFASHAYAAAKAGVIGLSKATASYYAPHNIRVNVVAPALVETPMSRRAAADGAIMNFVAAKQPLDGGRIGTPDDVEGAVMFLLSRQSRFITGQVLAVDGGWTISDGPGAAGER